MMRLPLVLFVLLAVVPATFAQAPVHATQVPDSTLAPYAGTWMTRVADTPIGEIQGTLTVGVDGTGTLTMIAMDVWNASVTGLSGATGALVGASTFASSVSGQTHAVTITLVPVADGTLTGSMYDSGTPYNMTAHRADP